MKGVERSIGQGGRVASPRRFAWSMGASTSAHGAVLGLATVIGGWFVTVEASTRAPVEMHPLQLVQPDFAEVVEAEPELVEPAAELDDAQLLEAPAEAELDRRPVEPEPKNPLFGSPLVSARLAWRVEPETEEAEAQAEPLPPVEPTPIEVEIALEAEPEVVEAAVLEAPAPRYPRISVRRGEAGTVSCRIFVSARGGVTRVEVAESSGHARLDDAAVEALLRWRFAPRREAGRARPATILHPVTFVLEDA